MVNSNANIYTLQTNINNTESVVHIETMISRGLYRFTLLGMNPKYASDAKDRVYAALRSSDLLNLKSDNRKIIVTLSPDDTTKKEGIYDLGIALSCISCIDKNLPTQNMLVLGGLSISGKIIPTKRVYQAIYTAHLNKISLIVCADEDKQILHTSTLETLSKFGIYIVSATYLKEVIPLLKNNISHIAKHKTLESEFVKNNPNPFESDLKARDMLGKVYLEDLDNTTRSLYISLCGGHNSIIETQSTDIFQKTYRTLYVYEPEKSFGQSIYNAYTYKLLDTESKKCILYIENVKHIQEIDAIKHNTDTAIGLYASCPCGYQYSFFETHKKEKKCICSKRSLIQHKRFIEGRYFSIFDIQETHVLNNTSSILQNTTQSGVLHQQIHTIRRIQFFRYIQQNNINKEDVFFLGSNTHLNKEIVTDKPYEILDKKAFVVWTKSEKEERVLRVAQTIQDILDFEAPTSEHVQIETVENYVQYQKEKPAISEQALLLALSYIPRMDS